MIGIIIVVFLVIIGIFTGLNLEIPYSYSQYIAVAILACLDSVFGAFVANIDKKFKMDVFISGFFGNAIIAMFLVFIGQKLNVDIYLAAVIVFSSRLINNFAIIRRKILLKNDKFNINYPFAKRKQEETQEELSYAQPQVMLDEYSISEEHKNQEKPKETNSKKKSGKETKKTNKKKQEN